jgi:hypothetical protein
MATLKEICKQNGLQVSGKKVRFCNISIRSRVLVLIPLYEFLIVRVSNFQEDIVKRLTDAGLDPNKTVRKEDTRLSSCHLKCLIKLHF